MPVLHRAAVSTTRRGSPTICCIDVTTTCTNNDAISAYVAVNMMLFTKGNIFFPDILMQDKCLIKEGYLKSLNLGNGALCHSIDRREYKG